jgi:CDP-paratose 2-epimerase
MRDAPPDNLNGSERVGLLEWFPCDAHAHVEAALDDLEALGVKRLRTGVSWADWCRPTGEAWFDWLIPKLTARFDVLPCFLYVPPSQAEVPSVAAPPRNLRAYADFLDVFLGRLGHAFEYVELWNEPNNRLEWDYTRDPGWLKLAEMLGAAAYWARQLGKRVVLGGLSPIDPGFLRCLFDHGLGPYLDVVGVHGFPGSWDAEWTGWEAELARVQEVLDAFHSEARLWITETGYPTVRYDEAHQVNSFVEALAAPVDRVYWYGLRDLAPDRSAQTGFHTDERDYACGIMHADGRPKLLARLWRHGGLRAVHELDAWTRERLELVSPPEERVLVTGGTGFVGANLADRLLRQGRSVILFDSLARPGVEANLRWLREQHGERARFFPGDVRDPFAVREALGDGVDAVYHLAAQVAVTTSLLDPLTDFDVNARGTLTVLEAVRALERRPPLVFTSTNKVYGALQDVALIEGTTRYVPVNAEVREHGIDERRTLDLHSPYGCSKGAADQYVLDYARSFGLEVVVLRMSCIYGPRQLGTEDQGWVAHFMRSAREGTPVTVYGDGKQVRDVLFVDDLVDALLLARERSGDLGGRAFNLGGGPGSTLSLLELLRRIAPLVGAPPEVAFADWRVGDQRYYVSDTRRFAEATGWRPRHGLEEGLERLAGWLGELPGGVGDAADRLLVAGARAGEVVS